MFVATVTMEVDYEYQAMFHNAAMKQAEVTLDREVGCMQFDVSFYPNRKSICFMYQVYETQAAYDHHLMSDHYITFDQITAPWVASRKVEIWDREEPLPQV
jgi:quinol monooxygenase YgiN